MRAIADNCSRLFHGGTICEACFAAALDDVARERDEARDKLKWKNNAIETLNAEVAALRERVAGLQDRAIAAAWDYMKRTPSGMAHAEGLQAAIRAAREDTKIARAEEDMSGDTTKGDNHK